MVPDALQYVQLWCVDASLYYLLDTLSVSSSVIWLRLDQLIYIATP